MDNDTLTIKTIGVIVIVAFIVMLVCRLFG